MINFKTRIPILLLVILFTVSCNPKQQKTVDTGKVIDTAYILKLGDTITNSVQKLLLANVMTAMSDGGPVNAVSFCNIHAISLTDSLAGNYNCMIQRVSDKYRNPANKLTGKDAEILANLSSSKSVKPVIVNENGRLVYYKPIKIAMPACMKCHGQAGKEIDAKTMEIISQKYPDDLATGYKEGDLRGLWKITFLEE